MFWWFRFILGYSGDDVLVHDLLVHLLLVMKVHHYVYPIVTNHRYYNAQHQ